MLPLLQRPSLKALLRHTREALVCEMDLCHQRVLRDGGVLRIQPLQVGSVMNAIPVSCFFIFNHLLFTANSWSYFGAP